MSIIEHPYDESYPPSLWTPAPATGATAGIPGTWTPAGSAPPASASVANTNGIVASPTTLWTVGQYVQGTAVGAAGRMYWSGTTWVGGAAPVAEEPPEEEPEPEVAPPPEEPDA
jgi:hypothetical protein